MTNSYGLPVNVKVVLVQINGSRRGLAGNLLACISLYKSAGPTPFTKGHIPSQSLRGAILFSNGLRVPGVRKALFNILTGVFVERAVAASLPDREELISEERKHHGLFYSPSHSPNSAHERGAMSL